MRRIQEAFGQHLTLDGYGCPEAKLSNLDLVYQFLENCPDLIRMTKIMPPYVFKYFGKVPEDWGVSGFVLIAESHISIHTFPEKGFISLDIFSCKDFDGDQAAAYATEVFGMVKQEMRILERGLEFGRNVAGAQEQIIGERRSICGEKGG